MSQPVQHQKLFGGLEPSSSLNEAMERELLELRHRTDELLRQLTTTRQRMDELHAILGNSSIPDGISRSQHPHE
jgi:hypothetical protein